jgi:FG-GAP-like repeat
VRAALVGVVASLALLCCAPAASADWNGNGKGDVLAIDASAQLLLYPGVGDGTFAPNGGQVVGAGWSFTALLATEWSGDRRIDLLARTSDGTLLMYRGNGRGGFVTGTGESLGGGWQAFTALLAPGDFSGDGKPDILAVQSDGALLLYRGNGDSGFAAAPQTIGSGWAGFTALLGPGDFDGDGNNDLLARGSDGILYLYRGNGRAGWATGNAESLGGGWAGFTALAANGDFTGDNYPDVLARKSDGALLLYRGNGSGLFAGPGEPIGAGWQSLNFITVVGQARKRPPAPSAPPPGTTPIGNGRVRLTAGDHCVPPGGRLHVSLKVRKRKGHKRPRVAKVVFFVRNGPRRVDRKRPYAARLPLRRPAGSKGRVYARVYFRRAGTKKLRRKTVARRYVMCS